MNRVLPILFNTEMVKAILEGRKTVTRRCIWFPSYVRKEDTGTFTILEEDYGYSSEREIEELILNSYLKKPYQPGDILYVRETWLKADDGYYYRADETPDSKRLREDYGYKWRPSIHMSKAVARIWLKVTNVRVERLQDITSVQAWNEGARCSCMSPVPECAGNKEAFRVIWDSTIQKSELEYYGWKANPWVWVIEFKRCEKPEGMG